MVQQFKQIIYCNDNSAYNQPAGLRAIDLINGAAFSKYTPLSQLGVQAPPGTAFYVNGGDIPAIVGFTGLFDIDLTAGGEINSLKFNSKSLEYIRSNDSAMLIVDMAYWTGGVEEE